MIPLTPLQWSFFCRFLRHLALLQFNVFFKSKNLPFVFSCRFFSYLPFFPFFAIAHICRFYFSVWFYIYILKIFTFELSLFCLFLPFFFSIFFCFKTFCSFFYSRFCGIYFAVTFSCLFLLSVVCFSRFFFIQIEKTIIKRQLLDFTTTPIKRNFKL